MILAGDIGGTHTRLALYEWIGGRLHGRFEKNFPSREYPCLESVLAEFLAGHPCAVSRAAFGIAGPVKNSRCEATNLPWIVDAASLARKLGIQRVGLMNDLAANACGIAALEPGDFVALNEGRHAEGNRAVLAAGTGLGKAGLYWDGHTHRAFASEGGHADFAPRNRLEMELLHYLLKKFKRVSSERALSGPGLVNIYRFLRDTEKAEEPAWLAEMMRQGDPARTISGLALDGKSALCSQALDIFVSLYGAEAGNTALNFMAVGGVYIGGGIAPKIITKLKEPAFMNAFRTKGRLSPMLLEIPVRVIMNTQTALLGAARHAALDLEDFRL